MKEDKLRYHDRFIADPRILAGSDWIKELYNLFAPVRVQAGKDGEKDVNEVIDEAVHAVHKAHE